MITTSSKHSPLRNLVASSVSWVVPPMDGIVGDKSPLIAATTGSFGSTTALSSTSSNGSVGSGLAKNANLYWYATTALALWFLFVHTPPILIRRKVFTQDPLFVLHLLGAGGIYFACIHNALVTPSTFQGRARPWHVWTGRIGMGLGLLGAISGAILTWTRIGSVGLSFGIPITIGGIFQLFAQWRGYHFIRLYQETQEQERKLDYDLGNAEAVDTVERTTKLADLQQKKKTYLSYHIGYMVGVFVAACGIPAVMRLLTNVEQAWPYIVCIVGLNVVSGLYAKHFIRRIPGKPLTEEPTEESSLLSS